MVQRIKRKIIAKVLKLLNIEHQSMQRGCARCYTPAKAAYAMIDALIAVMGKNFVAMIDAR